ncbi:MAG: 50S ribosomal protein L10 [PVC group bacterium]
MRPEKEFIKREYANRIRAGRGVVVTEYRGLSSETFNRLRSDLARQDADCLVVKNRIIKRILKDIGMESLDPCFQGQTAVVITDRELPPLLRMIIKYEEEVGSPRLKGAFWLGTFFDGSDLKKLAVLPSRDELLSRVLAGIQAPVSGLVGVLNAAVSGLVRTIQAIHDRRSS